MTSATSPSIGVLVCTHQSERRDQLSAAVASVRVQTRTPDELLVVVDGDESLADLVRTELPDVKVLCLGTNQGVSVARTRGAEALGTDLVVFLDDDAVAEPGWLARLLVPLADPDVLGSSGRSVADFLGPRPGWLADEFLWVVGCSYRGMPTEPTRVRNFFGGCAMVRRSVFLEVGGFDPSVGHHGDSVGGGEEADFCLRATAATGGSFAFEPAAVIHHRVPVARLTWGYFLTRCYGEGRMKARIARQQSAGALGPEAAFARQAPLAILAALRQGRPSRAAGILLGCTAVAGGLVRGSRG
jgi:GT2 family glycosyltransferase